MSVGFPNDEYERSFSGPVAGIDEAGRGPLAGPVVAAAVVLDMPLCPAGIDDSKRLSQDARETLYHEIIAGHAVGIGVAEPEEIDRSNILSASMAAMRRACAALPIMPHAVLVDGNRDPGIDLPSRLLVKGDSRSVSIAAASIIAKVTRDRIMRAACARYPLYGFGQHKGYPTSMHRSVVAACGASPVHRRSFAPVAQAILTKGNGG